MLFLFFILIGVLVLMGKMEFIDSFFHLFVLKLRNTNLTSLFNTITELGGASCLLAISIMSLLLLKNKRNSVLLLINLVMAYLLNQTVKSVFMRTRPVGINLIDANGYSFPSGHSMVSLAFYGFVIYLIYKNFSNKLIKWLFISILSIVILLIGFSRIYLGVHYFSDVVGGFLLAFVYIIIFINFIKIEKK